MYLNIGRKIKIAREQVTTTNYSNFYPHFCVRYKFDIKITPETAIKAPPLRNS
jgi:hypothetical protein